MVELNVERAIVGTSLQDGGRKGYLRAGIAPAGAMDWARLAMANQMLENPAEATVIEVGASGIALCLNIGQLQLSFAGPRFSVSIDGIKQYAPLRFLLKAGQCLEIVPQKNAMWGYIGIKGVIQTSLLLGSLSENSASKMIAKKITTGEALNIDEQACISPSFQSFIDPFIAYESQAIGILPAAQYEDFPNEAKQNLVSSPLMIEPRYNRMAYRLTGIQLECLTGHDILSDGINMGAIQVPGDGQPFILMADHQTTGGYPKIASVCKADLPRLAQMAPNRRFLLKWLTLDEAMLQWSNIRQQLQSITPLSGF